LKTERYEQEGEPRYFTKLVAQQMLMLDRKPEEPEVVVPEESTPEDE